MTSPPVTGATGALPVPEQLFSKRPAHAFAETIRTLCARVPPHVPIAEPRSLLDSRHRCHPRRRGPPSPKLNIDLFGGPLPDTRRGLRRRCPNASKRGRKTSRQHPPRAHHMRTRRVDAGTIQGVSLPPLPAQTSGSQRHSRSHEFRRRRQRRQRRHTRRRQTPLHRRRVPPQGTSRSTTHQRASISNRNSVPPVPRGRPCGPHHFGTKNHAGRARGAHKTTPRATARRPTTVTR